MPAAAHLASCSPPPALPGVPEMPTAPITRSPARIGTPPAAVVMFGRRTGPGLESSFTRLPYSPDGVLYETAGAALRKLCTSLCAAPRVHPRIDRQRQAGGTDDAVPADHFIARHRFGARRNARQARYALRRRHRKAAQLARTHVRPRAGQPGEVEVVAPADEVDDRRARPLVRDVLRLDAGHVLVELAGEMAAAAEARRAVVELARARLRPRDEFLQRLRRRFRIHHQQEAR